MNYLLRDIDPDLWRTFKARAAFDGRSLRDVMLEGVSTYAHGMEHTRAATPLAHDTQATAKPAN